MATKNIRVIESTYDKITILKGKYMSYTDTINILLNAYDELTKLKCVSSDQLHRELQEN